MKKILILIALMMAVVGCGGDPFKDVAKPADPTLFCREIGEAVNSSIQLTSAVDFQLAISKFETAKKDAPSALKGDVDAFLAYIQDGLRKLHLDPDAPPNVVAANKNISAWGQTNC